MDVYRNTKVKQEQNNYALLLLVSLNFDMLFFILLWVSIQNLDISNL